MTPTALLSTQREGLCCGCDAQLDESRFCARCETVSEVYSYDASEYQGESRIAKLLADRCHEMFPVEAT